MKFVLASHNRKKLAEMQEILGELGVEVVLQSDVGLDLEPEENGTTFAENAAIKHNTQAAAWTYKNMDQALTTMKRMGFSYDLDRMVKTCSPDYYRWGQWIFEKLWEKGLVYRKKNPVNWCPNCKTVLANEQVTEGECWRCRFFRRASRKGFPKHIHPCRPY